MSAKPSYLNLLVLLCVLHQGIIGTLSKEDIDESSEILDRQKRVINLVPGEDRKEHIKYVPYVVPIKAFRIPESCVGVILTNLIVLTVAICVELDVVRYRVYSGTARTVLNGRYVTHTVTNKRTFNGNNSNRPADGVALITVRPGFIFSLNTKKIDFYEGHIQPGTFGMVSGWGCNPEGHPGTAHPEHLRSISVPIISNEECSAYYHNHFLITEKDICTLDRSGNKYCGVGDTGAPLVIQVNYNLNELVGIHLFSGRIPNQHNPDIFINLQNPIYKNWIMENIPSLEALAS